MVVMASAHRLALDGATVSGWTRSYMAIEALLTNLLLLTWRSWYVDHRTGSGTPTESTSRYRCINQHSFSNARTPGHAPRTGPDRTIYNGQKPWNTFVYFIIESIAWNYSIIRLRPIAHRYGSHL